MSENQTLFLFLCLLYLAECLVWVDRRSVALVASWGRGRWRVCPPNDLFGSAAGSFLMANPLVPSGTVLRCSWLPVALGPAGVTNVTRQTPPGGTGAPAEACTVTYEDIRGIAADGKRLLLNGARFAACATPGQAKRLAGLIDDVRNAPAASREAVLRRHLAARHDTVAAAARLESLRSLPPMLSPLCYALLALLYVMIPAAAHLLGAGPAVLVGGPLLLVMAAWIACLFLRAHRRLYPDCEDGRVTGFISLFICPPAAIRARVRLAVDLLESFDPVTVRLALGPATDRAFFGAVVRDLSHPLLPLERDAVTEGIVEWFHQYTRGAVVEQLSSAGIRPAELCAAPTLRPGEVYCPRCLGVFAGRVSACPDCRGVATRSGTGAESCPSAHERK